MFGLKPATSGSINALSVLFTKSLSGYLDRWERPAKTDFAKHHIVDVDADARSSVAAGTDTDTSAEYEIDRIISP